MRNHSNTSFASLVAITAIGLLMFIQVIPGWSATTLVSLGDSLTEGVQSLDANIRTQPNTYINLLAQQMGVSFHLPLIKSGPRGVVGETEYHERFRPYVHSANLAVSGADVDSLLHEQAVATTPSEIQTETELVLFPRTGSQIQVMEALRPSIVVCWIGNNDVLGAAIDFNHLDASQMTPVADFQVDYQEIVQRITAAATKVVLLNIPNVTDIGFLMDRDDLIYFLGSDFGLPEGSYTTILAMFMIKMGYDDGSIIHNPDYVLDPSEIALIQQRVDDFNQIIADTGATYGVPVVDINALFHNAVVDPYVFFGISLQRRLLGGIFSLDGIHPSNIAHAIITNEVIDVINDAYDMTIPKLSQAQLEEIFLNDPFVDKDEDGRVSGRRWAGELETLGPILGISGDRDDSLPDTYQTPCKAEAGHQLLKRMLPLEGENPDNSASLTGRKIVTLFKRLFALPVDDNLYGRR